jgi:hypothetical protein
MRSCAHAGTANAFCNAGHVDYGVAGDDADVRVAQRCDEIGDRASQRVAVAACVQPRADFGAVFGPVHLAQIKERIVFGERASEDVKVANRIVVHRWFKRRQFHLRRASIEDIRGEITAMLKTNGVEFGGRRLLERVRKRGERAAVGGAAADGGDVLDGPSALPYFEQPAIATGAPAAGQSCFDVGRDRHFVSHFC